jgi:hypothetical protein
LVVVDEERQLVVEYEVPSWILEERQQQQQQQRQLRQEGEVEVEVERPPRHHEKGD